MTTVKLTCWQGNFESTEKWSKKTNWKQRIYKTSLALKSTSETEMGIEREPIDTRRVAMVITCTRTPGIQQSALCVQKAQFHDLAISKVCAQRQSVIVNTKQITNLHKKGYRGKVNEKMLPISGCKAYWFGSRFANIGKSMLVLVLVQASILQIQCIIPSQVAVTIHFIHSSAFWAKNKSLQYCAVLGYFVDSSAKAAKQR